MTQAGFINTEPILVGKFQNSNIYRKLVINGETVSKQFTRSLQSMGITGGRNDILRVGAVLDANVFRIHYPFNDNTSYFAIFFQDNDMVVKWNLSTYQQAKMWVWIDYIV